MLQRVTSIVIVCVATVMSASLRMCGKVLLTPLHPYSIYHDDDDDDETDNINKSNNDKYEDNNNNKAT